MQEQESPVVPDVKPHVLWTGKVVDGEMVSFLQFTPSPLE